MKKLTVERLNQINGGSMTYWGILGTQISMCLGFAAGLKLDTDNEKLLGLAILPPYMLKFCYDVLSYTIYGAQNDVEHNEEGAHNN